MTVATLSSLVGRQFEPTEWITVDQERIDAFANCTDDHQFIHVDPQRVARETAFPATVAHGFLLLSLAAGHRQRDFPPVTDVALTLNYGIDKLRFISPVFAGQRVRYLTRVLAAEPRGEGRVLLRQQATLQIEGQEKPALVAELLALYVARGS
ncbi:MAG: MaoC family dehydratase [Pseudomonadota bacterium]